MALLGQTFQEVDNAKLDPAVVGHISRPLVQLCRSRQMSEQKQIGAFKIGRMCAEFLNADTTILEDAALPIDVADGRCRSRHSGKSRHKIMRHGDLDQSAYRSLSRTYADGVSLK